MPPRFCERNAGQQTMLLASSSSDDDANGVASCQRHYSHHSTVPPSLARPSNHDVQRDQLNSGQQHHRQRWYQQPNPRASASETVASRNTNTSRITTHTNTNTKTTTTTTATSHRYRRKSDEGNCHNSTPSVSSNSSKAAEFASPRHQRQQHHHQQYHDQLPAPLWTLPTAPATPHVVGANVDGRMPSSPLLPRQQQQQRWQRQRQLQLLPPPAPVYRVLVAVVLVVVLVLMQADGAAAHSVRMYDELHIGGIFPIGGKGGWQGGQACMPAARMALEDVNNENNLLPGFKLTLHSNDSECEPGLGASVMYNLLYNKPQKLMLLAGCSTVCTTVAEAAKMWNLIVLCYGASSPALSDRSRFPTLFRTHPSATVHNPTRIKLMQKFGWSRVAILQQAEEVFISTVEDLENRCKEASIEIVTRQSFLSDPADAVRNLRRQDARIIVGLFYVVAARRVLCEMYRQQLYGRAYVWFFIGWYEDDWYQVNLKNENISCTADQMRQAAEGHLTTEALMWNQNDEKTISGMSSEDFRKRLNQALTLEGYDISHNRYPEGYQEAPLAYDAVWSVALAFNKTMERLKNKDKPRSLKDFTYTDRDIADEIYAAMNSTQFLGVSGVVAFSSQGDRIALTQIEQMIGGQYIKLGYYDTQADNLTWRGLEEWSGHKVPQDRTIVRRVLRTVSLGLFTCMSVISGVGILVAIGLIIFNIWNRHRRVIQSSHPVCNTIMLCGVIICLTSVVLLGIDGRFVDPDTYPTICQTRAWLLSTGFTLAYGAMFSKVWRVHRFTTKQKQDPKKKVEPWKLYTMVTGLLVIDLIILIVWQVFDPLQRKLESFPLEDPVSLIDDIKIRPQLEHCESVNNSVWLSLIYGFKGLILVFGLFLAYETRSIKVKQINDSRYVGMSIYNVVVLCLITAPVAMVIASQQDASFVFISLAVIFCCFLSMLLIFVPKVIEVIRHPIDKAESKYNPDTSGISKEDEERYQKLLCENEDLQRMISQKEDKIRMLRQRIVDREATAQQHTKVLTDGPSNGSGGGSGGNTTTLNANGNSSNNGASSHHPDFHDPHT